MITNYPTPALRAPRLLKPGRKQGASVRKTKRHCLESIDLSLSTFDGTSTTITFVRRNFGCSGPTWRVRKFKLIDITPASQQRLARALDARPMHVLTMALPAGHMIPANLFTDRVGEAVTRSSETPMTNQLTRKDVAARLRQLADELDPPTTAPADDRALARDLLRTAGCREPHLSRLARTQNPQVIIAWLDYLLATDYPAEHRIGYLIRRLDAGGMPPSGPHGHSIEDILPRRPRR